GVRQAYARAAGEELPIEFDARAVRGEGRQPSLVVHDHGVSQGAVAIEDVAAILAGEGLEIHGPAIARSAQSRAVPTPRRLHCRELRCAKVARIRALLWR